MSKLAGKANFHKDLKRGEAGQLQFLSLFPGLVQTDGKKGDFLAPDGSKIELKTDFYPMAKTANFFMERYSSIEVGSPGGPWQAAAHGCDWFVYFYTPDTTGFIFKCSDLLQQLEAIEAKLVPVEVRNVRWTTVGYKVPRTLLKPVAEFSRTGVKVCDGAESVAGWQFTAPVSKRD